MRVRAFINEKLPWSKQTSNIKVNVELQQREDETSHANLDIIAHITRRAEFDYSSQL